MNARSFIGHGWFKLTVGLILELLLLWLAFSIRGVAVPERHGSVIVSSSSADGPSSAGSAAVRAIRGDRAPLTTS
jgi:hypothetical protein